MLSALKTSPRSVLIRSTILIHLLEFALQQGLSQQGEDAPAVNCSSPPPQPFSIINITILSIYYQLYHSSYIVVVLSCIIPHQTSYRSLRIKHHMNQKSSTTKNRLLRRSQVLKDRLHRIGASVTIRCFSKNRDVFPRFWGVKNMGGSICVPGHGHHRGNQPTEPHRFEPVAWQSKFQDPKSCCEMLSQESHETDESG